MAKSKTEYQCAECGHRTAKWHGKCPGCGSWNTLTEGLAPTTKSTHGARTFRLPEEAESNVPTPLDAVGGEAAERRKTGIGELDRVLGGGLVPGGLVLVGGDPGIGKSTLLLQTLDRVATSKHPTLYVTGEESKQQIRLRSDRLRLTSDRVHVFAETRADAIVQAVEKREPRALVVDSIQSVFDPALDSAPGSVSQIREVAARFLYLAKARGVPTLLVGHVTKDGALAGPRVLEHLVDTVLYFERSSGGPYRILRAHKNRFGSTNEIGVFEMRESGLEEVLNPSALFLSERPEQAPGSVVTPALEGTRPILVEVQALVSATAFGTPRRTCLGFDASRAALLVAVLEQRAGLQLLGCDVFVNVAGGLELGEPSGDLAVALALASSLGGRPVPPGWLAFGEVGLAGELRSVQQADLRLAEAEKLGFTDAIVPPSAAKAAGRSSALRLHAVSTLSEAVDLVLERG